MKIRKSKYVLIVATLAALEVGITPCALGAEGFRDEITSIEDYNYNKKIALNLANDTDFNNAQLSVAIPQLERMMKYKYADGWENKADEAVINTGRNINNYLTWKQKILKDDGTLIISGDDPINGVNKIAYTAILKALLS